MEHIIDGEVANPTRPILLVDNEKMAISGMKMVLMEHGYNHFITCSDSREVTRVISENEVELVLLDLMMPYVHGEDIIEEVHAKEPDLPLIVITAVDEVDTAVKCLGKGACDYITKPVKIERLVSSVQNFLGLRQLARENSLLRYHLLHEENLCDCWGQFFITKSARMLSVLRYCEAIATGHSAVLITGETGAGKELIARGIDKCNHRPGELVTVNVAGLDDQMFADTLFGHVKGSFTGASVNRPGLIEKAANGTLFLDEIGDLSLQSQVKLLRLIEEQEYMPLGSDVPKHSSARIIAATHQNLKQLVKEGKFRKDLYFRLATHHVEIPPLREHKEDIPLLLDFFLNMEATQMDKKLPTYRPELIDLLMSYHFPGNIRELKGMVEDALALHKGYVLSHKVFKEHMALSEGEQSSSAVSDAGQIFAQLDELPDIKKVTRLLISEAMTRANNNQSIAAKTLGISHQALSRRLKNS